MRREDVSKAPEFYYEKDILLAQQSTCHTYYGTERGKYLYNLGIFQFLCFIEKSICW